MTTRRLLPMLFAAALPLAACGGDDGGGNPDAAPPDAAAPMCPTVETADGTISAFPGTFTGSVLGAGADLHVAMGVCDVEGDPTTPAWFDETGEDQVVHLTGLTANSTYAVILNTQDDLGFYVITGCDATAGQPLAGQCLVFDDNTIAGEQYVFTAPASGEAWVVVDTTVASADLVDSGNYTLDVIVPECQDSSGCSGTTPVCVNFNCVQCASDFDCTSSAPVCDTAANTCGAGPAECTGDDAADDAPGDDGPGNATVLATPTLGNPTSVTAAICSQPASESDWYKFTLAAETTLGFDLSFAGAPANDFDIYLYNSTGGFVNAAASSAEPEDFQQDLPAGDYYVQIQQYAPTATAAAAPYTLTVNVSECASSFDCANAASPVCSGNGICGAGPADCVGDDGAEDDDGPAAARDLTPATQGVPQSLTGNVCNSGGETDWYKVTVAAGQGLTFSLTFVTVDLDILVFDATGNVYGASFWKTPEQVDLSYLPAGTYYIQVTMFSNTPTTTVAPYTISATTNGVQSCTTSDDCDNVYSTQVYRGACANDGSCGAIPAGTATDGAACDSSDDCNSGLCSYVVFEDDAHLSICTETCAADSDCTAVGSGLHCSAGGFNMCTPACAADLDCGASPNSTPASGDTWSYYTCTTSSGVCNY